MKILLTGKPGCGKSTLVAQLIGEVKNRPVAGLLTPEIREAGRRTGFAIVDLASGERAVMASVHFRSGPRVSKYRVSVDHIDRILDRFLESYESARVVFIDEIGKMEDFSKKFQDTLQKVLESDKTVVATVGLPLLGRYRARAKVIHLENNPDEVFDEIRQALTQV